jgi:hypothetical protein
MYDVAGVIRAYPSSFAASDEGFLTRRATYEEFSAWLSLGPASASGKPFKYSTVESYLLVFCGQAGGLCRRGQVSRPPFLQNRARKQPAQFHKQAPAPCQAHQGQGGSSEWRGRGKFFHTTIRLGKRSAQMMLLLLLMYLSFDQFYVTPSIFSPLLPPRCMQLTAKSDPVWPTTVIAPVAQHLHLKATVAAVGQLLFLVMTWACGGRAGEAAWTHFDALGAWEALSGAFVLDWYQPKTARFRYSLLFPSMLGPDIDVFKAFADAAVMGVFNEEASSAPLGSSLRYIFPRYAGKNKTLICKRLQ